MQQQQPYYHVPAMPPAWLMKHPNALHTDGTTGESAILCADYYMRKCEACQARVVDIKHCSRCQVASYCSAECQKKHWPTHKPQCTEASKEEACNWRACRFMSRKPLFTAFIRLIVAMQDQFAARDEKTHWVHILVSHNFQEDDASKVLVCVGHGEHLKHSGLFGPNDTRGCFLTFAREQALRNGTIDEHEVSTVVPLNHRIVMNAFRLMSPPDAPDRVTIFLPGGQTSTAVERMAFYDARMARLLHWMYSCDGISAMLDFASNMAIIGPENPHRILPIPDTIGTCERILLYRDVRKSRAQQVQVPIYSDYTIEPVRMCPSTEGDGEYSNAEDTPANLHQHLGLHRVITATAAAGHSAPGH